MNFKVLSLALVVITISGVAIADTVTTPAPSSTTASNQPMTGQAFMSVALWVVQLVQM